MTRAPILGAGMTTGDPNGWHATTALLEALGGANAALWRYDAARDRLLLMGDLRQLGLQILTKGCGRAALLALVDPDDRAAMERLFTPDAGSPPITVRIAGAAPSVWRGVWLEHGLGATGVILPAPQPAETRDVLTGLLDRSSFMRRIETRLKVPGGVRLITADLARLRRLNEGLGPERADLVLRVLGARLASLIPGAGAPARIGEDEFAFFVDDPSGEDVLPAVRAALEAPLSIRGVDIHPSLWIGVARTEGGADADAHELLRKASMALQIAKSAGKTLSVAKPPAGDGLTRLALEADLHGALARGEIVPFYQPIAHLETGRLAGFEALARWKHPRRGLILPDDFLPLIADAGQMGMLGRHILATSAAQIAAWRTAHPEAGELFIAVNLTTGEIEDERLADFVAELVRRYALPARALKIEITESDIMRDPERAAVTLLALRDAGAGISLDDFGTGFSSLAYLTRLPFETLKIDRYFVRTMGENEGSEKIVRSVASLGRDLGLEVVAEGVETVAVARRLAALGCQYGQGFGYAPALDAREAEVYLNESYLDGAPLRQSA
jgi:c-di-GMP-specific phosphodiesterase